MDWQREVAWRRFDEHGEERAGFACEGDVCGAEGVGAVAINGSGLVFQYRIELDSSWAVRRAGIVTRLGADEFTLMLERHDDGAWSVGGVRAPQFDGAEEIEFAFSPVTESITVKHLGLGVGETRSVRTIVVTEPELMVEAHEHRYRRLDETHYEYESDRERVVLTVDDDGLVIEHPGMFEALQTVAG